MIIFKVKSYFNFSSKERKTFLFYSYITYRNITTEIVKTHSRNNWRTRRRRCTLHFWLFFWLSVKIIPHSAGFYSLFWIFLSHRHVCARVCVCWGGVFLKLLTFLSNVMRKKCGVEEPVENQLLTEQQTLWLAESSFQGCSCSLAFGTSCAALFLVLCVCVCFEVTASLSPFTFPHVVLIPAVSWRRIVCSL